MSDEILIAGAGIGGLTTALSLHQAGFNVRIFDSVTQILPLGVGINLLPHAVRELDELGLLPELATIGVACRALAYYTKRGELIWSEPRGLAAGYRWPQISLHRGKLQLMLLSKVHQRIGSERIHLGMQLIGLDQVGSQSVRVHFEQRNANSQVESVDGRLLIACDGIHSRARKVFYPAEAAPRWNGAVMWRGVVNSHPVLDGATMIMAGHQQTKFVCYPISSIDQDGKQQINFIAERRFDSRTLNEREDWNCPGVLDDFLPAFQEFRFDWLDAPAMIESAEAVWTYPMVDRDPLPQWSFGSTTLLGDAAHPMYPIGSNGASQAILDARILAGCLRSCSDDLEEGLKHYEGIRLPATAQIVSANRAGGPETVMQLVEDRAPNGFESLSDVVSPEELQSIADRYKQVAGFAKDELNNRASLSETKR